MPSSTPAPLGLLSAASWGAGDFYGGLAARRAPALAVVTVGFATGLAVILAAAIASGEPAPPAGALGWAAAAGAAGAVGLAALYRGLADGQMAVVAPVSALLSAAVPALWGALEEGLPRAPRLLGFGLALAGIALVARPGHGGGGRRGLGLALVAGTGFGGFLVLMHEGARGGPLWPLAAARGTSLALVLAAALARRQAGAARGRGLALALLSGVFDAGGNAFYVLAGRAGRLDVAAVLSSMYPAGTVALARLLLRERVTRSQAVGVAALLAAVVLIAAS